MLRLDFTNAIVKDSGYGLHVNGKPLDDIISTALGTKVGSNYGYNAGLPAFESTCCNVIVIIDPQKVTTKIKDDDNVYYGVEDMEAEKYEQFKQKNEEADPEE